MSLDAYLLDRLVCPQDRGPLLHVDTDTGPDEVLYNPRLRVAYRVDDGIPVLLLSEARPVDDAEHAALVARADR